jgi:GTP-binding protein
MGNSQYALSLRGTFYSLEQLRAFTGGPAQAGAPDEPRPELPEIAFAGRSNVGKSSLINALAGRRNLAKVSATPGKTASLNFYLAQGRTPGLKNFYLVDLPGYGYAKRSKAERVKWAALINAYLQNSKNLAALCILLDCRLEPQDSDLELIAFAGSLKLRLLPLLTKSDKCGAADRLRRQAQWKKLLNGQAPLLTSVMPAKSGAGAEGRGAAQRGPDLDKVWEALLGLVEESRINVRGHQ